MHVYAGVCVTATYVCACICIRLRVVCVFLYVITLSPPLAVLQSRMRLVQNFLHNNGRSGGLGGAIAPLLYSSQGRCRLFIIMPMNSEQH